MEIPTYVYERYLATKGAKRVVWYFVRRALVKLFKDPECSMLVHGRILKLPVSHPLPAYLKNFRFYDRLPWRVSEYIHNKYGYLKCIDVGANVGDTIASFYKQDEDVFLAIEPNPKFSLFLIKNWGLNKNIIIVEEVCSSESKIENVYIREGDGTAAICQSKDGLQIRCRSLDEIVADHSAAAGANVLKVDTDGHDFEVIRGAHKLISHNLPTVLFECDAFGNVRYVEDCLETLSFFKQSGYNHFLLYDNFGNLMGRHSLSDLTAFKNLLFYQLTSTFCYFDILCMTDKDLSSFYKTEIEYYTGSMTEDSLRRTVTSTIESLSTEG